MSRPRTSENTPMGSRKALVLLTVLFVVLFGGLSAWVIWCMSREAAKEADASPAAPVAGSTYTAADARTLLLITEDEEQAQGFVLVRFDPAATHLRTLALPRETVTDRSDISAKRLFELYQTKKGAGMTAYVETLTGFPVDFYAVVTYDGLEDLLNQAQTGLSFTLPENLRYDMGTYTIHIDGGEQLLSATQVTDVLRYPAWNGGRLQRSAIQAQIISACINQYFTPDIMREDSGYDACVAVADTNLLREPYYACREAFLYMTSKNNGDICQSLSVNGTFTGTGEDVRFYLEEDIRPALRSVFGATAGDG